MIYIVSGFFRSGTSMMMQALEAGGLPVYYSRERNALNEAYTDSSRRPNPKGLYEPSPLDLCELGFPRQHDGCAVKILVPWLSSMAIHEYRVVMMRRDPETIMDSYERTFNTFWDGASRSRWIAEYPTRFNETERWFKNRRDVQSVSVLEFVRLQQEPLVSLFELSQIGWPIDCHECAQIVEPKLCLAS